MMRLSHDGKYCYTITLIKKTLKKCSYYALPFWVVLAHSVMYVTTTQGSAIF
jgi:hypothetical protein